MGVLKPRITQDVDNILNKLNKKLMNAYMTFGVASGQYQQLAVLAQKYLGAYGIMAEYRDAYKIRRTFPELTSGRVYQDFYEDLKDLELEFKKVNLKKERGMIERSVREDREGKGMSATQIKARVTLGEIQAKASETLNINEMVKKALDYLYDEHAYAYAKLHSGKELGYVDYYKSVQAVALNIMHRSKKSYNDLIYVVGIINALKGVKKSGTLQELNPEDAGENEYIRSKENEMIEFAGTKRGIRFINDNLDDWREEFENLTFKDYGWL